MKNRTAYLFPSLLAIWFLTGGGSSVWGQEPAGGVESGTETETVIVLDAAIASGATREAGISSSLDYSLEMRGKGTYEVLRAANQAYEADQLEKAIGYYQVLLDRGIVNGDVYFNLANTYFRAGDFGRAVLYYEKARDLRPRDVDIQHNLAYTQSFLIDKQEAAPASPLEPLLVLHTTTTVNETLWILAALNLVLVAVLLCGIAKLPLCRSVFFGYARGVVLLLFILQLVSAVYKVGVESGQHQAVILENEVKAKAAPNDQKVLVELNSGTKVDLLAIRDGFAHVRLANGVPAFVPEESLAEI